MHKFNSSLTKVNRIPRVAYITLWYPKPSETFIVGEVDALRKLGMPITVYALYGKLSNNVSKSMEVKCSQVERLGCRSIFRCLAAMLWWWKHHHKLFMTTVKTVLGRSWRDIEQTGENYWAFMAGCMLARVLLERGTTHIHAGWANGPATAAWTVSLLTGISFSFTGRAGDIYPPDGALVDKIAAAQFVRTDAFFNIEYLQQHAVGKADKIFCVRNMLSWDVPQPAEIPMNPPIRLLTIARFVETKGIDVLLNACSILKEWGTDFRVTLAGTGRIKKVLLAQAKRLGIEDKLVFPGFILHDDIPKILQHHDILVVPSKISATGDRDGLPTVIMEALLSRVPVVATNVGGIKEVIVDGETGLLVQQKNPSAIAAAILNLASNRENALRMAENGKRRVLDLYNVERNSKSFYNLIVGLSSR